MLVQVGDTGKSVQERVLDAARGPLIFLAVALLALAPLLVQIAWPFLTPFMLASILAIVITPANNWVGRRIRRSGLATFLTTFATVLLLGIVLGSVGPM